MSFPTWCGRIIKILFTYKTKTILYLHSNSFARYKTAVFTAGTTVIYWEKGAPLEGLLVRKEAKGHGTNQFVEGLANLKQGDPVVVLEDVVTTGGSLLKACQRIELSGLKIVAVCTILDREEGGREQLQEHGYTLQSLFTRKELLEYARD